MPVRPARFAARLGGAALLALPALLPLTASAQTDEARFDAIAEEVAALRELPPAEIDNVLITPEELRARLPELLAEDFPAAETAADTRGFVALGLLPAGTDLLDLYLRILGEQVAGYYDPRTNEMAVIDRGGAFGAEEEFTYAHEVVHALQDAHLGLDELTDAMVEMDGDAAAALVALAEGDASLASYDYLFARPELAIGIATAGVPASPELDAAPGALAASLLFPYTSGLEFATALRDAGGWAAVDAAYDDLPRSTEQILHPEKYLAARDDPTPVALPDLSEALGVGWEAITDDVLGEFTIALLLANLGPGEGINPLTGELALPEGARNAAAGWDGDHYALWANGDDEVLVWSSVWDTEADARAFARALALRTQERFGGTYDGATADDVAMTTPDAATRLLRSGSEVLYVQAPSPALAAAALGALR